MSKQLLAISNQPNNIRTCPHCLEEYTLGIDGTVNGCDECEGIVRNPVDNTIINFEIDEETFIKRIS